MSVVKFWDDPFKKLEEEYDKYRKQGRQPDHKPALVLRVVLAALEKPRGVELFDAIAAEWEKHSSDECPDPKKLLMRARQLCIIFPELGFSIPPAKLGKNPVYIRQIANKALTKNEQKIFDAGIDGAQSRVSSSFKTILNGLETLLISAEDKDIPWIEKLIILVKASMLNINEGRSIHTYRDRDIVETMKKGYRRKKSKAA